jgi:hypothetical protein
MTHTEETQSKTTEIHTKGLSQMSAPWILAFIIPLATNISLGESF